MLFAGLYEYWRSPEEPADAEMTKTCTIITTTPNEDMDAIHDRMPVVLELDDVETWINVREHEPEERLQLTRTGTKRHARASRRQFGRGIGEERRTGVDRVGGVDAVLILEKPKTPSDQ